MTANFAALLSKPVESAEKPPLLPMGTYLGMIQGHRFDESRDKKTPFVEFEVKLLAAEADVDQAALAEIKDLSKRTQRVTFYLTDDSLFRLREFLENHVKLNCKGRGFGEVIPETTNQQIKVHIKHVPSKTNVGEVYANVDQTAAA